MKRIENNAENVLMSLNTISSQNKKKKEKRKHTADLKNFQEKKKRYQEQLVIDFIKISI